MSIAHAAGISPPDLGRGSPRQGIRLEEALAARALSVTYDDLPSDAVHWAKVSIIDTLGVALAGASEPAVRIVRSLVQKEAGSGQCTDLGSVRRLPPIAAAQVNGTAAHALDFDQSGDIFYGHPTVHLLPSVLAATELEGADGRAFIAAYVAGFEVQGRIARAVHPRHFQLGWFPTGTLGVFGAAAATAKLLGLSTSQIADALSLAAMFSAGVMAHAGGMGKPLGAGNSARNGLMAALLVREGFEPSPGALADRRGFMPLFNGRGEYDVDQVLESWGDPYDVVETALVLKQYPCCGRFHAAIDALSGIVREHAPKVEDVERIEADLTTTRLAHIDRPDPRTEVDARFSVQYCLARTLLHGRPSFEHFEGEAFLDPQVRTLMSRVDAHVDPAMKPDLARDEEGPATVRVVLADGRVLSASLPKPHGRVPGAPLGDAEVDAKFLICAKRTLTDVAAAELLHRLRALEAAQDMRDITAIIAGGRA